MKGSMATHEATTAFGHTGIEATSVPSLSKSKSLVSEFNKPLGDISNAEGKGKGRNAADLERELQDERRKNRKVSDEVIRLTKASDILRLDNENYRNEVSQLKIKLQNLVRQKGTLESKCSSLKGTAEDLSRRDQWLRRVEQTLEQRKKHTIDQLAEENCALQTQLQEADKRILELHDQIHDLEASDLAKKEMINGYEAKTVTLAAEIQSLTEQLNKIQEDLQNYHAVVGENGVLQAQLREANEVIHATKDKVVVLTTELKRSNDQRESAGQMYQLEIERISGEFQGKITGLERTIMRAEDYARKIETEATEQQHKLQGEIMAANEKLRKERKAFEEDLAYALARHENETNVIMAQLDEEANELNKVRAELTDQKTKFHTEFAILQKKYDDAVQDLESRLHEAQAAVVTKTSELDFTQKELAALTYKHSRTVEEYEAFDAEVVEERAQFQSLQKEITRFQNIEVELTGLKQLLSEAETRQMAMVEMHRQELSQAEAQYHTQLQLTSALTEKLNAHVAITEQMQASLSSKDEECQHLQSQLAELTEQCKPFRGLMDQLANAEIEREKAFEEAEKLASMNAQLAGHQNAKQKIKYVERMRDELYALKKEVVTLRAQVQKQKP